LCVLVVQSSESAVTGRQPTVNLLHDLLSQFNKLSDETDVIEAENRVTQVSERLNELTDRLTARRAAVEVRLTQPCFNSVSFPYSTVMVR